MENGVSRERLWAETMDSRVMVIVLGTWHLQHVKIILAIDAGGQKRRTHRTLSVPTQLNAPSPPTTAQSTPFPLVIHAPSIPFLPSTYAPHTGDLLELRRSIEVVPGKMSKVDLQRAAKRVVEGWV